VNSFLALKQSALHGAGVIVSEDYDAEENTYFIDHHKYYPLISFFFLRPTRVQKCKSLNVFRSNGYNDLLFSLMVMVGPPMKIGGRIYKAKRIVRLCMQKGMLSERISSRFIAK